MLLGTTYILGDEKAMGLYEMNLQSPMGSQRRYQIIHVIRDDRIAEYRQDLGLAKTFRSPRGHAIMQIRIPSYMEHTVNELKKMADEMRDEEPIDLRELVKLDKIKTG